MHGVRRKAVSPERVYHTARIKGPSVPVHAVLGVD
jgi:hypothetical protein